MMMFFKRMITKYRWFLVVLAAWFLFTSFFTIQWAIAPIDLNQATAENIYVINLDRTPERHLPLKRQLDTLKLPFTRWSAVDGYLLTFHDDEGHTFTGRDVKEGRAHFVMGKMYQGEGAGKFHYQPHRWLLSAGELGCTLSHRHVWQHISDHKIPWAIVFEDDAQLDTSSFRESLSDVLSHLPTDWDVVYLFYPLNNPKKGTLKILGNNTLKKFKRDRRGIAFTHAYMISCKGAQKLLAYEDPIRRESDGTLGKAINEGVIEAYIYPFPMVTVTHAPSTLDTMRRGR
jgi:glycosyl transferase family 25